MRAGKLRVVCDTNVLLSMLGFPGGRLDILWELIQQEHLSLFLSDFILEELARNLRKKVRLESRDAQQAMALLRGRSKIVPPAEKISVIARKDSDHRILECAVAAQADVLVTGDLRDLRPLSRFQGIEILTPREFLDKYFSDI